MIDTYSDAKNDKASFSADVFRIPTTYYYDRIQTIRPFAATTFANIEACKMSSGDVRYYAKSKIDDGAGQVELEEPEDLEKFQRLDVGVDEYRCYTTSITAAHEMARGLPEHRITQGVETALTAKLDQLLQESRTKLLDPNTSEAAREELRYSRRDLMHALAAIATSLNCGVRGNAINAWMLTDAFAWFKQGTKSRNSGFNSQYSVCFDEYNPDENDHASELAKLGLDDMWPDEFHNPARLDVRVDPAVRIEFIYTPEAQSAQERHHSHSEVSEPDGKKKVYQNKAISIRIDLDPKAPHGIALDIGRSSFDGDANGRHILRDADLLGGVFERLSDSGSHEYAGFEPGMAEEFRNFAERFAVQLDLQKKNVQLRQTQRAMSARATSGRPSW
ncbi:hypothetical protein EYC59_01705 [Candidatus Saccharibacteria bacterium]|nr:MAG: hypothetical protein EYC59_01705 [Candidatus Saccharibacteria bacterium]